MGKKIANLRKTALGAVAMAALLVSNPANAVQVGLELLLLVDVSGSVQPDEYDLQKTGYVNAFKDPTIQANIASISGGVAVAYAEWSGQNQQAMLVDWTLLTDAQSSDDFADDIDNSARAFGGLTAPGSAINWGVNDDPFGILKNKFDGNRLVIDISGDGRQNDGIDTATEAAAANAAGITVNGLVILGENGVQQWYKDNITDPGGGFLSVASGFGDFEAAVKAKIGREITGVPEPATLLLMGLGLLGLGLRARKRG